MTDEVLSHGATDVTSRSVGECWVIDSTHDWLNCDLASFFAIVSDPERGPNTSRVAILLTAFCEGVWTSHSGKTRGISGKVAPPAEVSRLLADGSRGRVVAFRPPSTEASQSEPRKPRQAIHPHLRLVEDEDLSEAYDQAFAHLRDKERTIDAGPQGRL
jgi:hypothetical protein